MINLNKMEDLILNAFDENDINYGVAKDGKTVTWIDDDMKNVVNATEKLILKEKISLLNELMESESNFTFDKLETFRDIFTLKLKILNIFTKK